MSSAVKTCEYVECGKKYTPRKSRLKTQKFCSVQCVRSHRRDFHSVEFTCQNKSCRRKWRQKASQVKGGKGKTLYCSAKCRPATHKLIACAYGPCQEGAIVRMGRGKYCSSSCYGKAITQAAGPVCSKCGRKRTTRCNHCINASRRKEPSRKLDARVSNELRKCLSAVPKRKILSKARFRGLPYGPKELRAHIESLFQEGMTWENRGGQVGCWTLDHIRPLASFYYVRRDDPVFRKAWALENLKPEWLRVNSKKGSVWMGRKWSRVGGRSVSRKSRYAETLEGVGSVEQ